jgi:CRISPR-associated endonuclease/helicase Cas3
MAYYAHSKESQPPSNWQHLEEHLKNVAEQAEKCAAKFQSADWGWNAGWLHDLGKAAEEFQTYLLQSNGLDDSDYDEAGYGRVNHSSAGASFATETFGNIIGLPLAYLAAGHHAGLPDYYSANTGRAALTFRIEEGKQNLNCIRWAADEFHKQIRPLVKPPSFVKKDNFHFWVRMLFSCLVDADFIDTENFINPDQGNARGAFSSLEALKPVFDSHKRKMMEASLKTPVNVTRRAGGCRENSRSLHVGTGR